MGKNTELATSIMNLVAAGLNNIPAQKQENQKQPLNGNFYYNGDYKFQTNDYNWQNERLRVENARLRERNQYLQRLVDQKSSVIAQMNNERSAENKALKADNEHMYQALQQAQDYIYKMQSKEIQN